jgi:hypothetical protein
MALQDCLMSLQVCLIRPHGDHAQRSHAEPLTPFKRLSSRMPSGPRDWGILGGILGGHMTEYWPQHLPALQTKYIKVGKAPGALVRALCLSLQFGPLQDLMSRLNIIMQSCSNHTCSCVQKVTFTINHTCSCVQKVTCKK